MRSTPVLLSLIIAGLACGTAAADVNFPERKAGQWEISMEPAPGLPAIVTQLCIDAATDKAMMESGMAISEGQCSKMDVRQEGGSYIADSVCTFDGATTNSRMVMSGDFSSSYTVDITAETTGGSDGMPPSMTMRQVATWKGACPAGMAPGDMVMPGGMKMNIPAMLNQAGGG
jgi:hypothetical protein